MKVSMKRNWKLSMEWAPFMDPIKPHYYYQKQVFCRQILSLEDSILLTRLELFLSFQILKRRHHHIYHLEDQISNNLKTVSQMAMSLQKMSQDFVKLERFEGGSFRRWQKMHFLLTALKVVNVLTTPIPKETENETLDQTRERVKWENDDYICRGHILNALSDALFDVYENALTAKEVWDSLQAKYLTEDATSKKFIVGQFMNFRTVDTKPVIDQIHELQHILI